MAMSSKEKKPKGAITTLQRSTPSPELELPEWRKDARTLRRFFLSLLWEYPVHAFIGKVVKGQPSISQQMHQCI